MNRNLVKVLSVAAMVMMLGVAQRASADPVGGLVVRRDRVLPNYTDTWTLRCYGDEITQVTINGDGSTDLDLYVYDENGNLICKDEGYSDDCVASFRPFWTQTMTIKVVNRGGRTNRYSFRAE